MPDAYGDDAGEMGVTTAGGLGVTVRDVERTAQDTAWAQWSVAAVVMVGSMAAGGFAFHDLGEPWALGVVTAFAVDLALAAWLRIAARLRALGLTAPMGWVLEVAAAGMTLFLNVGAAVFQGINPTSPTARVLLAVAHSFLPLLLVLVTMAGGQAQLSLLALRRDRQARDQAQVAARRAAEQARHDAQRQRITAERDADSNRTERAHAHEIRVAELTATHHDHEITERREARAHAQRHLIASLASLLTLGATWHHHPHPRARRTTPAPPQRVPNPRTSSAPSPVPVPPPVPVAVTEELLARARQVRAQRASEGKTAGRAVLQRELEIPEKTARELVRRLSTTPSPVPVPTHHDTTVTQTEPEGKAA